MLEENQLWNITEKVEILPFSLSFNPSFLKVYLEVQSLPLGEEEGLQKFTGNLEWDIEEDMRTDYVKFKMERFGWLLKNVFKKDI